MAALLLSQLLLAAIASAQSTTTATILLPSACVTQANPTVNIVGTQNDRTTYTYDCNYGAAASSIFNSLLSNLPSIPPIPSLPPIPSIKIPDLPKIGKRLDISCPKVDVCIPWEVTQGASFWAAHYTAAGIGGASEECNFGDGGIASGAATCTARGNIDLNVGTFSATPTGTTQTLAKSDVDKHFARNTVTVTSGGQGTRSTGLAVPKAVPTGMVAMAAGAGGILAAALAL